MLRYPPKRLAQVILAVILAVVEVTANSSFVSFQIQSDEPPLYTNYKGVQIGMSIDEARKKLGEPADKNTGQDFYEFSPDEMAQVSYDASGVVTAIAVTYFKASDAPTAKNVLGVDIEPQLNGNLYKLIRYPKAGYWVSYSRTEGDPTVITLSMTKIENKPNETNNAS
jgi:hypothetical protein